MPPFVRPGAAALGLLLALAPTAEAQSLRASGPPERLVADGEAALAPKWSPDGGRIAFTRDAYRGLWTARADGSGVRQIADWDAAGFGFSWSPDGGALVARPARLDGPNRLNAVAVVDAATGESSLLTEWRAQMPALPQWTSAAAVVLDDEGALEALAVERPVTAALRAAVRPAVAVREEGLVVVQPGGAARVVAAGRVLNPVLSPDGQRVAFEEMGGGLAVVQTNGGGRVDLGAGHRPAWSPDGRWVVFQVTTDDGHDYTSADLAAARADGSARVRLTNTPDRLEMNPSWSPDGRRIAYDDLSDGALYVLPVSE